VIVESFFDPAVGTGAMSGYLVRKASVGRHCTRYLSSGTGAAGEGLAIPYVVRCSVSENECVAHI
jgi:hypothetical protein